MLKWLRQIWQNRSLSSPTDQLVRLLSGQSAMTNSGELVTIDRAFSHVPVYACVRILAESIASLPLLLYRRLDDGGKDRANNHPLYWVLHNCPNNEQTSFEFFEMMVGNVALRGNFYAQIIRDGGGRVVEIIPLHPDRMSITRADINDPSSPLIYRYRPQGGAEIVYSRDKIWHVRGLSSDGIYGVNPITATREAISLSISQEKFTASTFRNGARPSGVLEHPGKMSKEAKEALEESFSQKYGGAMNAGRAPVLEENMKWHQLAMTNEDSQFLELRKFQIAEIARIFRIPLHMLAELDKATFSNIEQQSLEFVRDTLRPWLVRIEQSIWRDLLLESERQIYFAEFNINGMLRGDSQSRFSAYGNALQNGWMNRDEVRELENMNPIPGDEGKIYVANAALFPITAQTQMSQTLQAAPANQQQKRMTEDLIRGILSATIRRIQKRETRALETFLGKNNSAKNLDDFYLEHRKYSEAALLEVLLPMGEVMEFNAQERAQKYSAQYCTLAIEHQRKHQNTNVEYIFDGEELKNALRAA